LGCKCGCRTALQDRHSTERKARGRSRGSDSREESSARKSFRVRHSLPLSYLQTVDSACECATLSRAATHYRARVETRADGPLLRTIIADGRKVGVLWYGLRGEREAFVWDLVIYPTWRNQGFAKSAMLAMEQELRTMQVTRITLNVFAHNSVATRLYSTMGTGH
jgi:ribosomal protein S18 acetylase RimI-like enzyme